MWTRRNMCPGRSGKLALTRLTAWSGTVLTGPVHFPPSHSLVEAFVYYLRGWNISAAKKYCHGKRVHTPTLGLQMSVGWKLNACVWLMSEKATVLTRGSKTQKETLTKAASWHLFILYFNSAGHRARKESARRE